MTIQMLKNNLVAGGDNLLASANKTIASANQQTFRGSWAVKATKLASVDSYSASKTPAQTVKASASDVKGTVAALAQEVKADATQASPSSTPTAKKGFAAAFASVLGAIKGGVQQIGRGALAIVKFCLFGAGYVAGSVADGLANVGSALRGLMASSSATYSYSSSNSALAA